MTEKVIFYGSLVYNVLMCKFNLRTWYDRIDEHVLLGAIPLKGAFPKMLVKQENVRAVISMNQDFELDVVSLTNNDWKRLGVEFLQLPTKDFVEVPSLSNLQKGVKMMMDIIDKSKNNNLNSSTTTNKLPSIYVHCKAGRTRSTTLVACYLVKHRNMTAEQAVEYIQSKRRHIVLSRQHIEIIRKYQESLLT